jgi:hypothetical protein
MMMAIRDIISNFYNLCCFFIFLEKKQNKTKQKRRLNICFENKINKLKKQTDKMLNELSFCILTVTFITLLLMKTFKHYLLSFKPIAEHCHSKLTKQLEKPVNIKKKLTWFLNAYFSSFNSAVIFVGLASESYMIGAQVFGNLVSISIGYIVVFFVYHPFMYGLDKSITTPYMYLERRYGGYRYVRAISAMVNILFLFCFMTLYNLSCTTILSTIFGDDVIPLWISAVIFGIAAMLGTIVGGFKQFTPINIVQFVLFIITPIAAIIVAVSSHKIKDFNDLWKLAYHFKRANFIDLRTDFLTRYTIINQVFSLPVPW